MSRRFRPSTLMPFLCVWTGFLKVPADGDYFLDVYGSSDFQLFIKDSLLFSYANPDGADHRYKKIYLRSTETYPFQLRYANAVVKLKWTMPDQAYEAEAVAIAKDADAVVLCAGLSPRIEGEHGFGYGLSHTTFTYPNVKPASSVAVGDAFTVTVDVQNTGKMDGEEVVQLCLSENGATGNLPLRSLKGFTKVQLKKGEKRTVSFMLKPTDFSFIKAESKRVAEAADFEIAVGGKQPTTYNHGNVLTKRLQTEGL